MKKNNILTIDTALELPSYWNYLIGQNSTTAVTNYMEYQEAQELRKLFRAVKEVTRTKYEEVYLVVSDVIFTMVGVFPFVSDGLLMESVKQKLGESIDEYYLSIPIETKPPASRRKTVYAIHRKYVDRVVQAARAENITLTGIEPASMSFIRSMQEYTRDYAFVEMFQEESTIMTFSPIGGIYRNDAPRMSERELIEHPQNADATITQNFAANNFNGGNFFGSFSPDLQYYILTDNHDIFTIPAIRHAEPTNQLLLPAFIESQIPTHDQGNWMVAVGTLLQAVDEDILYPYKQASLLIQPGNLLPAEMQAAAKQRQWKAVAKRTFKGLAAVFITVICAELAGIMYFSSITVDPMLKADYDKAKADKKVIDVEMNSLKKSMQDDPQIMVAYERVLRDRPSGCGFSSLTIGSQDGKSNKFANQYIQIKAVSNDQIIFNDYIAALQGEDIFQNANVTSISGTKELMTAAINIGKKGSDGK